MAAPVGASPPQTLNGDWVGPPASPTNIWFADGNMFLTYTSETTLSGDIVGDMVSVGWGVLHPNGEQNMNSTGTFTGSFNGSEIGTADYVLVFRGTAPLYSGKMIFTGRTGGLANLHAVVTATKEGSNTSGDSIGTYTAKYHFAP